MEIYCFLVSGIPLTNAMRNCLHTAARQMIRDGKTKLMFRHPDFEGAVYTTGEYASLSWISGVEFTAVIESNQMTTRAKFIVRTGDLENLDQATWSPLFAEEDLAPSLN